jgi:sulfur carrier protein ThiS
MIAIHVKFVGERQVRSAEHETVISLPPGATVGDLLAALELEQRNEHMISRNSEVVSTGTRLQNGDRVSIFQLPAR